MLARPRPRRDESHGLVITTLCSNQTLSLQHCDSGPMPRKHGTPKGSCHALSGDVLSHVLNAYKDQSAWHRKACSRATSWSSGKHCVFPPQPGTTPVAKGAKEESERLGTSQLLPQAPSNHPCRQPWTRVRKRYRVTTLSLTMTFKVSDYQEPRSFTETRSLISVR